jgi:hypothetical protein
MWRRAVVALSLAATVIIAFPRPAAACQWVAPTLAEVAPDVDLIFVAEVAEVPEPRTHVLAVARVLRGVVPDTITYAPRPGEVENSCMAALEVGSAYVFGTNNREGALGIGDVWFKIDGDRALGHYLGNWTGTLDELYNQLTTMPNTAVPPTSAGGSGLVLGGLILITLGALRRSRGEVE